MCQVDPVTNDGIRAVSMNNLASNQIERLFPLLLVSEISSRVVNEYTQAIAYIRLAAAGVASAEGREALLEAASKLLNFAEAHRALQRPQPAERVDVGHYLARVCAAKMAAGLQERGVQFQFSFDAIQLDSDRCWWVALIVSELVTNSMRHGLHGGSGKIAIDLVETGGHVICRVTDNGFEEPTARPCRSLEVITGIAAKLEGKVARRSEPSGRTAFLTFPKRPRSMRI